jgi:hypothetical protein
MSFLKDNTIWIICILSFFSAFFYNQLNLKHIPKERLRENQTIITSDDFSYLAQPKNYLETGIWMGGSPQQKQSYFLRSPGYGIFCMVFLKIGGNEKLALKFLKIAQLLLFSLSVFWLHYIIKIISSSERLALLGACLYGLTPFTIGFLYYTLTEAITPALLLLYIFLLFKAYQCNKQSLKNIFYISASLVFSYLFIVRPVLGIFVILLPVFLFKDFLKKGIQLYIFKLLLYTSISFSFMAIWQVRNYTIANEFVGLHPIYYHDNNSMFRPTLQEFWNFNKSWGVEGHVYHSYSYPFWLAAIKGDTSEIHIKKILTSFPPYVVDYFGKDRLTMVFKKYQQATLFQRPYFEQGIPMPKKISKIEQEVVNEFKQLKKEYKKEFWIQYHFISTFKVFKTTAFHSNLSLYMFQKTYRGNFLMETIRYIFFGIHSLCFIALLVSLAFLKKMGWKQAILTLSVFIYVFYLCYFFIGIEERYTLPILPILLIGLLSTSKQITKMLRR